MVPTGVWITRDTRDLQLVKMIKPPERFIKRKVGGLGMVVV